jgi:hypothetical protein
METKVCKTCEQTKPLAEFQKVTKVTGTTRTFTNCGSCRAITAAARKSHYHNNPKKRAQQLAAQKSYYRRNTNKVKKYVRLYNEMAEHKKYEGDIEVKQVSLNAIRQRAKIKS